MSEFFYLFGVGIAVGGGFMVGVVSGIWLFSFMLKADRKEKSDLADENYKRTEDRLAKYVENTDRIACVMEAILSREKAKD